MNNPLGQGERGISIVGGIVAIAVLGTILVSVDTIVSSSNPNSEALVASAKLAVDLGAGSNINPLLDTDVPELGTGDFIKSGSTDPGTSATATKSEEELAELRALSKKECDSLLSTRKGELKPGEGATNSSPQSITLEDHGEIVEKGKCVSVFNVGTPENEILQCFGLSTEIKVSDASKGVWAVTSKPAKIPWQDGRGLCQTTTVDSKGKKMSAAAVKEAYTRAPSDDIRNNLDKVINAPATALEKTTSDGISGAYEDLAKTTEGRADYAAENAKIEEEKAKAICFEASENGDACTIAQAGAEKKTREAEAERAKAEELKKRVEDLREAQKRTTAEKPPSKEILDKTRCAVNIGGEGCPCPPGTYGARIPDCWRVGDNTFGGGGGGGLGGGAAGGPGGIMGLLQALGLGGQQPPAGNQERYPTGTCTGGAAVCSGNTIYSRNSQCVDTIVKYCEYGCAGNQCAQKPGSCPTSPAQPDASGCSGGTWKPTYTGACVSGWQCTNSQGDGPAAEISCQPEIADVGMEIAITYSCSAGTSSGAGFSTGGAQSGATTTLISSVPANTNTATYTLTCTDAGRSSNTSCKVQVGKPTIVLAANPAEVDEGESSALGWVTSGMKSCVISSPDLEDFTNQNAHIKNVNGTVTTPELDDDTDFVLKCTTVGGGTREATIEIRVD